MSHPEHADDPSRYAAEGIPDPDPGAGSGTVIDENPEPPHDTATAVEDFGTTPAEVHEGESLDGRLRRERPEVEPPRTDRPADGVGRLVEPDEGARSDTEKDVIASDVGPDQGGYTAEESAMHLEPER